MATSDKMYYDREKGKWLWKNPSQAIIDANPQDYGQAAPAPAAAPPQTYAPPPAPGTPVGGSTAPAATAPPALVPSGEPMSNDPLTDPNALDRFITPENTLINQRIGWDVRDTDSAKIDKAFSTALKAARGGGANVGESENLQYMFDQLRGDFEGGMNREDLIRRQGSRAPAVRANGEHGQDGKRHV
jgi:hypothetical protein